MVFDGIVGIRDLRTVRTKKNLFFCISVLIIYYSFKTRVKHEITCSISIILFEWISCFVACTVIIRLDNSSENGSKSDKSKIFEYIFVQILWSSNAI